MQPTPLEQGIEDQFLEQWHQKLHTNTTPEDIAICEGYLAFLRSNDMGEFWCAPVCGCGCAHACMCVCGWVVMRGWAGLHVGLHA